MEFLVVGYYTANTVYEKYAKQFVKSLRRFHIPHYVERVESLGGWIKNICFKPTFVKTMLKKFPDKNIVYVDVDAEFFGHPVLFDSLDCTIAVYEYDGADYHKKNWKPEVLSGTIFFKNNEKALEIVEEWERRCKRKRIWDQKHLQDILNGNFEHLPPEYCKIFDRQNHIGNPIIVHYQCSREVKKNKKLIKPRGSINEMW